VDRLGHTVIINTLLYTCFWPHSRWSEVQPGGRRRLGHGRLLSDEIHRPYFFLVKLSCITDVSYFFNDGINGVNLIIPVILVDFCDLRLNVGENCGDALNSICIYHCVKIGFVN
jgi:hypothetical protein